MYYCLQNHLPVLTVLVVNRETGNPGRGITLSPESHGDSSVERELVFGQEWYRIRPPSEEDFAEAYRVGHQQ
jgi:hypothetical protein